MFQDTYSAFKDAIKGAELAPNMSYSEYELAEKFGVSRTPVHEAAVRLQEEGLLKIIPKKGIVINAVSIEDMREIYDIILSLEPMAASLCARQPFIVRQALCQELTYDNEKMHVSSLEEWAMLDASFHKKLLEGGKNNRLLKMMGQVNEQSHRARLLTVQLRTDLKTSFYEHHALIEAIKDGDEERAFDAAKNHRLRAKNDILPLLTRLGLNNL